MIYSNLVLILDVDDVLYHSMDVLDIWLKSINKTPKSFDNIDQMVTQFHKSDHFRYMEPNDKLQEVIYEIKDKYDLYIISACGIDDLIVENRKYHLKEHFPYIKEESMFFLNYELSKNPYIENILKKYDRSYNIYIDDADHRVEEAKLIENLDIIHYNGNVEDVKQKLKGIYENFNSI